MAHRPGSLLSAGVALVMLQAIVLVAADRPAPPSFAVGVGVVSLSLVVTDTQGRPVPLLHASDLSLFEDGVPQEISIFTQEEWPIQLSILLDGSGSMAHALPVAKRAAARLVRTLRPGDEAQVAQFSRSLQVLQDSTGDQASLVRAIERVAPSGETALYNALYVTLKELGRTRTDDLARRAIVLLSDGEDTVSMVNDEQLLDLARRAGVAVYAIGLLTAPAAGQRADSVPTYFLTVLARETGGRAFFPRTLGELDGVYDSIARELRTLYGVGYVPQSARSDGSWHRIAIQTREPNLLVRHRSGYYAPGASRQTQVRVQVTTAGRP